jgi:hypothetical protein
MKYFLRRQVPPFTRLVLIESGSRHILESLIPRLRSNHEAVEMDLVTCYAGQPRTFDRAQGNIYRVTDYTGAPARQRLYDELRDRQHTIGVIICSGEPIMTKWKWMLAWRLPVKFLIVNENGDYFWCDRSNWKTIRHFFLFRAGLTGAGAVRTLAGIALFPFTLTYLLIYTAYIHLKRKVRHV